MTQYQKPSFTVPTGGREPDDCHGHHWSDKRGNCVFCGQPIVPPSPPEPSE